MTKKPKTFIEQYQIIANYKDDSDMQIHFSELVTVNIQHWRHEKQNHAKAEKIFRKLHKDKKQLEIVSISYC